MRNLGVGACAVLLLGCGRIDFDPQPEAQPDSGVGSGSLESGASTSVDFIAGIQGTQHSFVARFRYQPEQPAKVVVLRSRHLDSISGNKIRGLSATDGGEELWVGEGGAQRALRLGADQLEVRADLQFDGPVGGAHGLCTTSDGGLVIGSSGPNAGNPIAEYGPPQGEAAAFERAVLSTEVESGALSQCESRGDQLWVTDYGSYTDRDGDLVELTRGDSGDWSEVQRFDMSAFAAAAGYQPTGLYSFVRARDEGQEWFYLFPMRRLPGLVDRLIRCPLANLAACELLGTLPSDDNPMVNSPDTIQGAVAGLPGELLFASNQRLYRYELGTDRWEMLADLGELVGLEVDGGGTDSIEVVRGLVSVTR